ncbi:hypothetical protein NUW54_g14300 [Trametes sanguinea]|uniref:Uncharacterized protein n=1 Tax=Trametes sanguinea TaxID=158606 RepID=A0ACC1MDN2_9APHY|nr:hypothetical protein NUW54_g14300 [Trametes sanguinea]
MFIVRSRRMSFDGAVGRVLRAIHDDMLSARHTAGFAPRGSHGYQGECIGERAWWDSGMRWGRVRWASLSCYPGTYAFVIKRFPSALTVSKQTEREGEGENAY